MEKILNQFERKMGRHYIRDLMKYLCFGMLGVFILDYLPLARSATDLLYFDRDLILKGQIWRLITFVFLPPTGSLLWIILALYFDYFIGTSLENQWGSARFNLFYLIGVIGNILSGFIWGAATNAFLNLSLLLAFAVLYPEMEFRLFFFLPVKVKWLGMLDGACLVGMLLIMPWAIKLCLVLSLLPFVLFFGRRALLQLRMDCRALMRWIRNRR